MRVSRWEQIAERVPGRSKKEILARVRELKEMLKAKVAPGAE